VGFQKEKFRMTPEEIQELMDLKGWSKTRLAAELGLTEHAVRRWLIDRAPPSGPAARLMREWLEEVKAEKGPAGSRR